MDKKQLEKIAESKEVETKITLNDLVKGVDALNHLSALPLPVFLSYQISLFLKKSTPELEAFDKIKLDLFNEFGIAEKDKDGNKTGKYTFTNENAEKLNEKMKPALDTKIDIKVPTVRLMDLGDIKIEPKHLLALSWMIK